MNKIIFIIQILMSVAVAACAASMLIVHILRGGMLSAGIVLGIMTLISLAGVAFSVTEYRENKEDKI